MNSVYDLGIPHPVTPYPKLIINAAITGMVPGRKDSPHVPLAPQEIVADALRCIRAGASIVHLHARDEEGEPTYRKELFARIILGIREQCPEAILCVSTSGRRHNTFECRSQVLELEGEARPDMASLTLGSLNFPGQASVNTPEMIESLARKMKERGIVPEIEVFETGMIHTAKVLMMRNVLTGPFYMNILLGSLFSTPATLFDLSCMVKNLPPAVHWAAAGIGRFQLTMNAAAILMGGHVRVGLEDNLYYDREQLATNEQLIQRVVRLSVEIGRKVAEPSEARAMLGLPAVFLGE
ncbi:MAG: 3-keto-5-aminohexanoate cleavage protein [Syntrophotaleaceae bacterium]